LESALGLESSNRAELAHGVRRHEVNASVELSASRWIVAGRLLVVAAGVMLIVLLIRLIWR